MRNGFAVCEVIPDERGGPVDYRFLRINPAFEQATGLGPEVIGRTIRDVFPADEKGWIERYDRVMKSGESVQFRTYVDSLDKWLQVTAYRPVDGQLACIVQDITELCSAQQDLASIEWLLFSGTPGTGRADHRTPPYGDLSMAATVHEIRDAVGVETLRDLVSDFLNLLDSSAAVYERNGDYALGILSSSWCSALDLASRQLCDTEDNREALASGGWLCHESCWTDASLPAIESGRPVEIQCRGGIRIYAVPIHAGSEVVGAINFGFGSPPTGEQELSAIASRYGVSAEVLAAKAAEYRARPPFLVNIAKQRLHTTARIIGEIVLRRRIEKEREASHAELRLAQRMAGIGNWSFDPASGVLTWSDELYRIYERDPADGPIMPQEYADLYEDHLEAFHSANDRAVQEGIPFDIELPLSLPSGTSKWVRCICEPSSEKGAGGYSLRGTIQDITRQREAAEERKRNEAYLRAVLQTAGEGIITVDGGGRITEANEAYCRMVGYTRGELLERTIWEVDTLDDEAAVADRMAELRQVGTQLFVTEHACKGGGGGVPIEISVTYLSAPDERFVCFCRDLTERLRAEDSLKKSEAKWRSYVENAPYGVFIADREGRYREVNPAASRISGYDEDELLQMEISDILAPESRQQGLEHFQTVLETGHASGEEAFLHKNGEKRWWSVDAVRLSEGRLLGFVQDTTERHQARQELLESKDRFERMLAVVPDMILIQDCEMNVLYCNWQGFAAVPEERRTPGKKCYEVIRGLDHICPDCRARSVLETGRPHQEEVDLPEGKRVDVRVIPLLDSRGEVEMFMEWVRDTTEQKHAEEERQALQDQLAHARKMESIGRLAGGVAHDFNNMLTVILGNVESALTRAGPDDTLRESLEEIRQAGSRSADLTRQLLAFARKQTVAPRTLDLNAAVEGMLKMLRRLIGEGINLVWRPGPGAWPICMDPGQLQQILANLCVNARDAIGDVGTVTIETRNVSIPGERAAAAEATPPGDYVQLTVSDDGCGMDAETCLGVFEPFFTTKQTGDGTGLGLATVYGIVSQNRGSISVNSEPGEGATFTIHLPRQAEPASPDMPEETSAPGPAGGETVLLVEDEASILRLGTFLLRQLGYQVIAAESPSDAIRQAKDRPGQIDLLFTDVVMPEMNGRDLYRAIDAFSPGIRCLFTSGYPADSIADHGILSADVHFIQKPYSLSSLSGALREALHS